MTDAKKVYSQYWFISYTLTDGFSRMTASYREWSDALDALREIRARPDVRQAVLKHAVLTVTAVECADGRKV